MTSTAPLSHSRNTGISVRRSNPIVMGGATHEDGTVASTAVRTGPYELLKPLSSGSSGEVYVARLAGAGPQAALVAVKWMLPYLASEPERVTRFLDEVRLVARMRHPNIVP